MIYFFQTLIFILWVEIKYSYVIFPVGIEDRNLSSSDSPRQFIDKIKTFDLYSIINIGSQQIEVKAYIDNYRQELMIGGVGIKDNKYDEFNSNSYNCTYCVQKELGGSGWYFEGIVSTEDFRIKNNLSEISNIYNMKFILGKRSIYLDPPEGTCGLQLPTFGTDKDYNLIVNLKKSKATNSYNWFLDLKNIEKGESKLIIDAFPSDLNKNLYNSEKFKSTHALALDSNKLYPIWALQFNKISYNNLNMNFSSEKGQIAKIQFNFGAIIAPYESITVFIQEYFKEYFNKKICFNDTLSIDQFIYCKNTKELNINKFKSIYFTHADLNVIFELSYKDLFYTNGDYIYFLVLFRNESNWIFGNIFLKKYFLVFNQDEKTIGYYEGMGKEKENDKKNFKIGLTHILLLLILITLIVVGIILYKKKGNRKNRANELEDDYEYKESINEDNCKNKIIE